jgi:hypothetical protein
MLHRIMRHAYRAKLRLTTVAIFLAAARALLLLKRISARLINASSGENPRREECRRLQKETPARMPVTDFRFSDQRHQLSGLLFLTCFFMACARPSDTSARQSGRTRKRGGEIAIGLSSMTVK